MKFETYRDYVAEHLKDYLPEYYQDADLRIMRVCRIGGDYNALCAERPGVKHSVSVNLDAFYRAYRHGMDEQEMFRSMARIITEQENNAPDVGDLEAYASVRERLFIRICSAEMNKAYLQSAPHRCFEDLAMTCHVLIDLPQRSDVFASVTVRFDMLERYRITEDQLFEDALDNSVRVLPAKVQPLREALGETLTCAVNQRTLYVVTNSRGVNGAAALFYPGMFEHLAALLGNSYYILPSSIHKVLIVQAEEEDIAGELEELVRDVNRRVVDPSERLSDHVYR